MSATPQTAPAASPSPPAARRRAVIHRFRVRRLFVLLAIFSAAAVALWYGMRAYRLIATGNQIEIPTAKVQRGDVSLAVTARAEIRGGNPEVMTAPQTGGSEMHITFLANGGQAVKPGDVVVQFDTTEQDYKLREAEADLAEAEQHIVQATAQESADEEEDRYALLKARADVQVAELEARKNPILPSLTARQNDLALGNARDHLTQLESNLANHKATNKAAIAVHQAGKTKAEAQATTARQNIEAMTLKAHRAGYVALRQNTNAPILFYGAIVPMFQVGDVARPGMAIADILDLRNWELGANVGELDRGHLSIGQKVDVSIIAMPDRPLTGHVKELGATSGPPWDRHFECKIALDNATPELRPGMSATIVVTTDELHQVLWLPAQALFESDGGTFVYVRTAKSFTPKDVSLVRRNETRVVITGLEQGQEVALANPAEVNQKKVGPPGSTPALPR
jgi:HlyD family secretion protein